MDACSKQKKSNEHRTAPSITKELSSGISSVLTKNGLTLKESSFLKKWIFEIEVMVLVSFPELFRVKQVLIIPDGKYNRKDGGKTPSFLFDYRIIADN